MPWRGARPGRCRRRDGELYKEGAALSKEEKWDEAAERFEKSLELKDAPITHFSLAIAQMNRGDWVEALSNFRAFLNAEAQPATEAFREPAQEKIEELETKVARITITVSPEGEVAV